MGQMAKDARPAGENGKATSRRARGSTDEGVTLSEPRVIATSAEEREATIDALADLLAAWQAGDRAAKPRERR